MFFKKVLSVEEKRNRLLLSVQRFCNIIQYRCENGAYQTLYENYQEIHTCFETILQDRVYLILTDDNKMVLSSLLNRTLKILKEHQQKVEFSKLKDFVDRLITRMRNENKLELNECIAIFDL